MKRARKTFHGILIETLAVGGLLAIFGSSFVARAEPGDSNNDLESQGAVTAGVHVLKQRVETVFNGWQGLSTNAKSSSDTLPIQDLTADADSLPLAGTNQQDGLVLESGSARPNYQPLEAEEPFSRDPENVRQTLESAGQRLLARFGGR